MYLPWELFSVAFRDYFEYSVYNKQSISFSLPSEVSFQGSVALCWMPGFWKDCTETIVKDQMFSNHKKAIYKFALYS